MKFSSNLEKNVLLEKDDFTFCSHCFVMIESCYKMKNINDWNEVLNKCGERLKYYHDVYFKNGFQTKKFIKKDKMLVCSILYIVYELMISNKTKYDAKWLLKIISFAFSFDKHVILQSFRVIAGVYDLSHIACLDLCQQEILLKLSELDCSLNDLLPYIENKSFEPIEDINIEYDVFTSFNEYSTSNCNSDVYISLLKKLYSDDERFMSILKRYSVIILLRNLSDKEYYHETYSTVSLTNLQKEIVYLKEKNIIRSDFEEHKNSDGFVKDLHETLKKVTSNMKDSETNFDIDKTYSRFCSTFIIDIELLRNLIRYIYFLLQYNGNLEHVISILELDKEDGLFYNILANSLKNPKIEEDDSILILDIILKSEKSTLFNYKRLLEILEVNIDSEYNKSYQAILMIIKRLLDDNISFFNYFIEINFGDIICKYIKEKYCDDSRNDKIFDLLRIMFSFYEKQDSRVTSFSQSNFLDICCHLLLKSEYYLQIILENISQFITQDPSSTEIYDKLRSLKILETISFNCFESGKLVIELIDVMSLNKSNRNEILNDRIFESLIEKIESQNTTVFEKETPFFISFNALLRHHPEFHAAYEAYFI